MLLILACLVAATAAAPVLYDRRQDGELNVSADVQNVLLLFAYPQKMSVPLDILDFLKTTKGNTRDVAAGAGGAGGAGLQERADQVLESFMEPNTPYHVEIGSRNAEGDGRAAEVVIAGRRRLETEAQAEEAEADSTGAVAESTDELKLLGAREQCGPERERDPVTLACRLRVQPHPDSDNITPQQTPEVVSS